jgi:hypothetical protein
MWMFDYVHIHWVKCPNCKKVIESEDFQSKDWECILGLIDISEVSNAYWNCHRCQKFVEINI